MVGALRDDTKKTNTIPDLLKPHIFFFTRISVNGAFFKTTLEARFQNGLVTVRRFTSQFRVDVSQVDSCKGTISSFKNIQQIHVNVGTRLRLKKNMYLVFRISELFVFSKIKNHVIFSYIHQYATRIHYILTVDCRKFVPGTRCCKNYFCYLFTIFLPVLHSDSLKILFYMY